MRGARSNPHARFRRRPARVAAVAVVLLATAAAAAAAGQSAAPRTLDELRALAASLRARAQHLFVPAEQIQLAGERAAREREARELDLLDVTRTALDNAIAPWEMFAQQLTEQIEGVASWQGIQLVTIPVSASWNHPKYGKYNGWRVVGDSMPPWGASYRGTDRQVSLGYKLFIDNLDLRPPDAALAREADKARKEYDSQVDALERMLGRVPDQWKEFDERQARLPENRRLTYDEWYARIPGPKISMQQQKVEQKALAWQTIMNRAGGGYGAFAGLRIDYDNLAFQGAATSPADNKVRTLRMYNFTPDLGEFVEVSRQIPPSAPPRLAIDLDATQRRLSSESTAWSGGASLSVGFFGFGASASGGRYEIDSRSSTFQVRFAARNIAMFTVTPDGWYNGTAVQALKDGPWLPGGPVATGQIPLWGPDGVFNLKVKQVIVAYRPRVVARVSASEFHEIRSRFRSSGGFSIGPFGFGGSYSTETQDVHFDEATNTITAIDSTDVPQVLAVVSDVLPDSQ